MLSPSDEPLTDLPRAAAVVLSLRFVISVAVIGMGLGALLMFWEGGVEIWAALRHTAHATEASPSVITDVMEATDKFLFGIVLVIFTVTITCGFVLDLAPAVRTKLPRWIAVNSLGEMKHVFFEVILVYLAVDFVTDIASSETHRDWTELVMPLAILLLAASIRLLSGNHGKAADH